MIMKLNTTLYVKIHVLYYTYNRFQQIEALYYLILNDIYTVQCAEVHVGSNYIKSYSILLHYYE